MLCLRGTRKDHDHVVGEGQTYRDVQHFTKFPPNAASIATA